ncbi:MAG: TonB-dependent receptor, partial [Terracidiphilus sp.]
SSLADFLLGLPQETTIDATAGKSYLRENVWDAYASDDWRASNKLTLTYGLRYEYFAPYTEKYNRLGMVDTDPFAAFDLNPPVEVAPGGSYSGGRLPDSLVDRFRTALAPRLGVAWRLPRQIVLRAGYGVNYTVGQYATFASTMARQPIADQPSFVNEQTNEATVAEELTLADGFHSANANVAPGNYELDAHYHLPYVQAWNLDVQKTLPWSVVLNVGYNGSRGNHLDVTSAPRATPSSRNTDPTNLIFNYEQSAAFSKFNAGTLRVNKRLSNGISFGANYQYSHSIDDAGSVGGTSTVVAQDWQHLNHEEGNSSFDVRHKVTGNYLYELPFGKDKFWLTSGVGAHILEGFSISGSFTFATGMPLTPSYQAASADVARGTAGTLRPDRLPGSSLTLGGGSLKHWFNTAAFAAPAGSYGTASRNSISGPGTIQNNLSLSKTMQLGGTRSMELRATANNVFNTVQYAGVDTNFASPTFGQVTSAGAMRSFQFTGRFRF